MAKKEDFTEKIKKNRANTTSEKFYKKLERFYKGWASFREHHIIPRDRGGSDQASNKKTVDGRFHWCWHRVFGNLTPFEALVFVIIIFYGRKKRWNRKEIRHLQLLIELGQIKEAKALGACQLNILNKINREVQKILK